MTHYMLKSVSLWDGVRDVEQRCCLLNTLPETWSFLHLEMEKRDLKSCRDEGPSAEAVRRV